MNEYMRVWDASDRLDEVNAAAADGWRVIGCFSDDRRGTQFILERESFKQVNTLELVATGTAGVHAADPNGRPY